MELGILPSGTTASPNEQQGTGGYIYRAVEHGPGLSPLDGEEGSSPRYDLAAITPTSRPRSQRRWSVLEELDQRQYCRVRSCADCFRIINCKCLLATCMLGTFVVLAVTFAHVLFFATEVGSVRYDYIIVGSSSAGSLIAHNLVKSGAKVLLLEAGNATQYEIGGQDYFAGPVSRFDVPLMWSTLRSYAQFQWPGYPEDSHINLAKGLGGAGVIGHDMTYIRAQPSDMHSWNVPGLSWKHMQELYQSLEHFRPLQNKLDPETGEVLVPDFHGNRGPIATTEEGLDPLGKLFVAASVHAGVAAHTEDFNNPNVTRCSVAGAFHVNVAGGVRDSPALQFLRPIIQNPNLVLQTEATATRVLLTPVVQDGIDSKHRQNSQRAYGVQFVTKGVSHIAYLRMALPQQVAKELTGGYPRGVLLTAGAINSAQLLMNSGIGPADQIYQAENKVLSEGVGRNLQDHVTVGLLARTDPGLAALSAPQAIQLFDQLPGYISNVEQARHKQGHNSSSTDKTRFGAFGITGISAGAFLRSPHSNTNTAEQGADIQLTLYPSPIEPFIKMHKKEMDSASVAYAVSHRPNLKTTAVSADGNVGDTVYAENLAEQVSTAAPLMLVTVTLLKPEGSQRILLQEENLHGAVKFEQENQEPFTGVSGVGRLTKRDRSRLLWGLQQVRAVLKTSPMEKWVKEEVSPGPEVALDEQLSAWIDAHAVPANHWSGTCKMGPIGDPRAVVDERFRVYGVQDLRVVGAAIMPHIIGADIRATELALAEHASQIIYSESRK